MKRKLTLPAAVLLVLCTGSIANAASGPTDTTPNLPTPAIDTTPGTCDFERESFHVGKAKAVLRAAYRLDGGPGNSKLPWHGRSKAKAAHYSKNRQALVKQHRSCLLERSTRAKISRFERTRRSDYRRWSRWYSSWCAPPSWSAGGCFVIPEGCIVTESGPPPWRDNWSNQNPSSPARGAYMLLGHGERWPVNSWAIAMQHHRIAMSLNYPAEWTGAGC